MTTIDEGAVLDAMEAAGLKVAWEYPGLAVITFERKGQPTQVATGLNGWEYGTLNVLDGDMWQPLEGETAEPDITETETNPTTIAAAWASWVRTETTK